MKSRTLVYALLFLLFILHQDFWLWDNGYLVLDFLPIGLAYHGGFSIASALVWYLVLKYDWPKYLEEDQSSTSGS